MPERWTEAWWRCPRVAREIEVTARTIQRDIRYMRDEMNLPLEHHVEKHGCFYTRAVNEFPLLQLSQRDLMALFLARKAMEPLRGTRLERMLAQSFQKIAEACPEEASSDWQDIDEAFSVKTTGVLAADVSLFGELRDAILERREVEFDCHKLTADKSERRRVPSRTLIEIEGGVWSMAGTTAPPGSTRIWRSIWRQDCRAGACSASGRSRSPWRTCKGWCGSCNVCPPHCLETRRA